MSLAGNVRELFALIPVDRSLLLHEVIHLCNSYDQHVAKAQAEEIRAVKRQAALCLRDIEQVTSDMANALLRDLLRITHYEHAC